MNRNDKMNCARMIHSGMKRVVLLVFFALSTAAPGFGAVESAGNVRSTSVSADAVDFHLEQGAIARVEMLDSNLVRVRLNTTGTLTDMITGAISRSDLTPPGSVIYDTESATYLATGRLKIIVEKTPFRILIFRPDDSLLLADVEGGIRWDTSSHLISNQKYALPDERYFGLGLRGGPLDRRGRTFVMKNVDWAEYGEFTDPLYMSIPFYYGVHSGGKAYGLFLDSAAFPFFDLDSRNLGVTTFGSYQDELDYYVMEGPSPSEVANTYARLTGFMPLPPMWTLGYHQSRYGYKSQAEILDLAATFRSERIPCDALYLDLDYMDKRQLFSWDPVRFPTPETMNASLEASGFKLVSIVDPVVRTDDRLWPLLSSSGYFLKNAAGNPLVNKIFFGKVSWLDFTKPAVRTWYKRPLATFLRTGVSAVWNDLNEPAQNFMSEAVYDFDGQNRTELQARNLYALQETSLSYEAQRELRPNARPWVLSRSGYSGIQRYAANWSGDTLSTFDSLRVCLQMSLSMGLSGQNQFGHDVGGFAGSPSPELFIRWLEFESFTPFFRNHSVNVSLPREPWRFGEPYTTMARRVIDQRYRLLPYMYTLFESAARDAQPVLAPTFFYFPSDPQTYSQDKEFMLGPLLLVAPVIQEGARTSETYLPEGTNWIDYYTDAVYSGGRQIISQAPLEKTPLFVREGAILIGGPAVQFVTEPVTQKFTVDVFPGDDSTFILYEDDGASLAYTNGSFLRTRFSKAEQPGATTFVIERIEGAWTPSVRSWWLSFHGMQAAPTTVEINGRVTRSVSSEKALNRVNEGWFYRGVDNRLVVRLEDTASPIRTIVGRQAMSTPTPH